MSIDLYGHTFERKPNNRVRDVSFYACTRCGKSVRTYSRSTAPIEDKITGALGHHPESCPGHRPNDPLATARLAMEQRARELLDAEEGKGDENKAGENLMDAATNWARVERETRRPGRVGFEASTKTREDL